MPASTLTAERVRGDFYKQVARAPYSREIDEVTLTTSEDTFELRHGFLSEIPRPQQTAFGGQVTQLADDKITLYTEEWEAPFSIRVDMLRRDESGNAIRAIREAARGFAHFKLERVLNMLLQGAALTAYDGSNFFAADHVQGASGTQSNLLTASDIPSADVGTATNPTPEEMAVIFMDLIGYALGWKDGSGRAMLPDARHFVVFTPTNMFGAAQTAARANNLASGQTNQVVSLQRPNETGSELDDNRFRVDVVSHPDLNADSDAIHVVVGGGVGRRPFLWNDAMPTQGGMPSVETLGENSEKAIETGRVHVYPRWSGGWGVGEPGMAYKLTLS